MTINILSRQVSQKLSSGQVIVDISSIVKELLENALDAGADNIDIILEEYGLKSIMVKDNGQGIHCDDIDQAGKRHYTSKLKELDDLGSLHSYGFRGEGLNSICQIADNVTVVTKTKQDPVGQQYCLDKQAIIKFRKPTGQISQSGTIITAEKPFYDLPVRRRQAERNKQTQLQLIKDMIVRYALIQHQVRFSFNKTWIKPSTSHLLSRVSMLFSRSLGTMLNERLENQDNIKIHALVPKIDADPVEIYKENKVYIYVNQRPIHHVASELKQVVSDFKTQFREMLNIDDQKKLPFLFLHIELPPTEYDVNLEPDKSTVLFHRKEHIIKLIEKNILNIAPPISLTNTDSAKGSQEQVVSLTKDSHPMSNEHQPVPDQQIPTSTALSISRLPTMDYFASSRSLIQKSQPTINQFLIPGHRAVHTTSHEKPTCFTNKKPEKLTTVDIETEDNMLFRHTSNLEKLIPQKRPLEQVTNDVPLNQQVKVIGGLNIHKLQMSYHQYRSRSSLTYRTSIIDYLKHPKTDTKTIQVHSDLCLNQHDNIEVYSAKDIRLQVIEIGVFKRKDLLVNHRMKQLVSSYDLSPKKPLSRPIQFEISQNDEAYNSLLAIESKESWVKDDRHGKTNVMYYDIKASFVSFNGFKARWRKEINKIIVQITAVSPYIPYYTTEDFKELLIKKTERPQKVLQYLYNLSYERQEMDHDQQVDLKQALDSLEWENQESGYDLGFDCSHTNIIAFRLAGLESN